MIDGSQGNFWNDKTSASFRVLASWSTRDDTCEFGWTFFHPQRTLPDTQRYKFYIEITKIFKVLFELLIKKIKRKFSYLLQFFRILLIKYLWVRHQKKQVLWPQFVQQTWSRDRCKNKFDHRFQNNVDPMGDSNLVSHSEKVSLPKFCWISISNLLLFYVFNLFMTTVCAVNLIKGKWVLMSLVVQMSPKIVDGW